MSGLASAQFGTKVYDGDWDIGLPLSDFAAIGGIVGPSTTQENAYLSYWDIGTTPGVYDPNDVVYLQFGGGIAAATRVVRESNIRMNDWGGHAAGTSVNPGDGDIGVLLHPILLAFPTWFPAAAATGFYYADLAPPGYSLDDPVYLKVGGAGPDVDANDIRIVPMPGQVPGSRVNLADADAGFALHDFDIAGFGVPAAGQAPTAAPAPVARLAFYNANGDVMGPDAVYNTGDTVYFDIDPIGEVSPNDVRLSEFN